MITDALLSGKDQRWLKQMLTIPVTTRLRTNQALVYLGLEHKKYLNQLVNEYGLKRHRNVGRTFCYDKDSLDVVRKMIDDGRIILK